MMHSTASVEILASFLRISLEDNCDMVTTVNEEGRQITESSRLYFSSSLVLFARDNYPKKR